MQRKAILISGRSGIVISCARFQNGGSNGLEGSKDCRSVGGHGNQHVRLRSAQVSLDGDDLPGSTSTFCFRTGAGVLQSKVVYPVHFEKLIGAFALMSAPDSPGLDAASAPIPGRTKPSIATFGGDRPIPSPRH